MKHLLTDANFPRSADQRVYHLGLRPGEVANRIITVGPSSRANTIAEHLDPEPTPFRLTSERGFSTITGRYKGVPISIISIGMGSANMDFFVREVRECLAGDMLVVRLGSCGGLSNTPVGTIVIPKSCVFVSRNVDFDFSDPKHCSEPAYRVSKPVPVDPELEVELRNSLELARPKSSESLILTGKVNASADSFYSSQGRQTSFPDHNEHLIEHLLSSVPGLLTLEMETHHLYHLAACWGSRRNALTTMSPLTVAPIVPVAVTSLGSITATAEPNVIRLAGPDTSIKAAAAQMVFANRSSRDFATPSEVKELEKWTGQAALDALVRLQVPLERLHQEQGSVWEFAAEQQDNE